ncbi:MAG: ATP-binding protein [Spirochaetales bacterium]|nr:ATP-binding protein [Spirochaetales bacterium]
MNYVPRKIKAKIYENLSVFPVVCIVGPRQCGKSTLAKKIIGETEGVVYLDLELTSDLAKLRDPEVFFRENNNRLVCLDEIQRLPEIFPLIRGICDLTGRPGQFLMLGSASPKLLRQSSESLAGRIGYLELSPFLVTELGYEVLRTHWLRGGFPRSYLAENESLSLLWRENFLNSFIERDIPAHGFNISSNLLRRLLTMLAHSTGQVINKSGLAESLGVTPPTIAAYLDILENTYFIKTIRPYHANIKKRLVKNPKVFIRDTGIIHSLLGIQSTNDLLGHMVYGNSWESYVLAHLNAVLPDWAIYFYRTSDGSEIDFILESGKSRIAIECKVSSSPRLGAGFYHGLELLKIDDACVISPLIRSEEYTVKNNITVCSIDRFLTEKLPSIRNSFNQ